MAIGRLSDGCGIGVGDDCGIEHRQCCDIVLLKLSGLCHDKDFLVLRQFLNTLQLEYLNSMSRHRIFVLRQSFSQLPWYAVAGDFFFVAT